MSPFTSRGLSGRAWAYAAAALGAVVSVAANVGHSYVPPAGASSSWRPHAGAVALAAFWPVALLMAVEVLARVPWPPERRWAFLRWGGLVPVAVVAAVVSYRHLSGLLAFYAEDPLTVVIGPAGIDGLMVIATGALLATADKGGRTLADGLSEASDEGADVPPLLPAVPVESIRAGVVPALSSPGVREAGEPPQQVPAPRRQSRREPLPRADVDDLLLLGQAVAADLAHRGDPLTRRALVEGLRARGHAVSTDRAGDLLRALRGAA